MISLTFSPMKVKVTRLSEDDPQTSTEKAKVVFDSLIACF